MNTSWRTFLAIYLTLVASGGACAAQSLPLDPSLHGRWDLTITAPTGKLPSWIEISQKDAQPQVVLVGVMDHAVPLKRFTIHGSAIEFVSPKGEEGFASDMLFQGRLVDGRLQGTVTDSAGDHWPWTGNRAPLLDRKDTPKWGAPVKLFNGADLAGWKLRDMTKAGGWKVENRTLVTEGRGSDLMTVAKFSDFRLHLEFRNGPSTNSGVYLRGRYEVQIETDEAASAGVFHTGGVYGFLAPDPEQPRVADAWQSFDITLVGRRLTVVQNGVTVIDRREIPGITGGALDSDEASPGPIYLQGTENGPVAFRNIVLCPARR